MMRDNQNRSLEDQIRSGLPSTRRESRDADSPEEIIRRSSERVGKKIKEIFSDASEQSHAG